VSARVRHLAQRLRSNLNFATVAKHWSSSSFFEVTRVICERPQVGDGPLLHDDLISTSVTYHHGIAVLAISGEMDLASAAAVEHAIAEVLAEDPPSLIIDLSGVQFLASVGVAILLKARDKFVDCERFSVVAQGRMTSRAIQLLDLDHLLSLQETVEEALSDAKARHVPLASPASIPGEPTA
jgi:anti-sigma B factor antagonist